VATLDSQIDALYQRPLDEFTSARNALAKTVSGPDAQRVRKLPKPTVVPWTVNQLYWHNRGVFDRLRKAGERLRAAQIAALKGKPADVRAAADAQRQAIAEAVEHASALAQKAGSRPNADELTRTLEALSLAPELPETPGHLTRALQPAGFEALAGVTPAAIRREEAVRARPQPGRDDAHGIRRQREEDAKREQAARHEQEKAARLAEAEISKADAAVDRAKASETQARAAWERAKRELEAAEQKRAALRKRKP